MKRRSFLTATLSAFAAAPAATTQEAGFYFNDLLHLQEVKRLRMPQNTLR